MSLVAMEGGRGADMKKCTKCEKEKDISEFGNGTNLSGISTRCRTCVAKYARERWRMRGKNKTDRPGRKYPKGADAASRLYGIWFGMKRRCYRLRDISYPRYGGRGISVCDEWRESFASFAEWSLVNGYGKTLSIDRKNNDLPYSPENCKWSTSGEQMRNTSRTVKIRAFGEEKCCKDWAEDPRCRVSKEQLGRRIKSGIDPETAIVVSPRPNRYSVAAGPL